MGLLAAVGALPGFGDLASFLTTGFLGLAAADGFLLLFFLEAATLSLASCCFWLILKDLEAPCLLTWMRLPFFLRWLFFYSTSYPSAARTFQRAARETLLRFLEAATALTMSSDMLGPDGFLLPFLALLTAALLAGFLLAAKSAGGAVARAFLVSRRRYNFCPDSAAAHCLYSC